MNPIKSIMPILAALAAYPSERAVHEIKAQRPAAWDFTPSPFVNAPFTTGQHFYGRTRGTRKAMKQAAKRRRILARLPK